MELRVRHHPKVSLRAYTVASFVEELEDGTLRYDITLTDPKRGTDVDLRIDLFHGEVVSAENHDTREQTQKTPAINIAAVDMEELVHLRPAPKQNPLKNQ